MKDLRIFYILIIIAAALILYFNPLFSNKPLGLDTLGHLSKISYIHEFPFAQWDMSWYNGAPFLEFYSPLFYYLGALFPNPIFGVNLLCFLSIVLTAIGIFFLVSYFSKNPYKEHYSLISSLIFLSVLCTSYYFISVGNLPYFFAIWTIPFSMLFLEKSFEKRIYFILFSLIIFTAILLHIFIGLCVILLSGIRIFCMNGISFKGIIKSIKMFILTVIPGILLSGFWLIPFLVKSSSYAGDSIGYIPLFSHLFGFGNYLIWGKGPGEIGITFGLFLILIFIIIYQRLLKDKQIFFLSISSAIFFLLLMGILGKYYPTGVGAIRFILPFSIIMSVFIGTVLARTGQKIKTYMLAFIFILIIIALVLNFKTINLNYTKYSYGDKNSRYGFMQEVLKNEKFPLKNEFDNYRFGTSRFIFSETLNFFLSKKSQTYGYYDQGILYPETFFLMRDKMWRSNDTNSSLYFIDWFGINYFEIGGEDLNYASKFANSDKFKENFSLSILDYPFILYEVKEKTPIISVLKTNVESRAVISKEDIEKMASLNINSKKLIPIVSDKYINISNNYSIFNFSWKRDNPDNIEISFNKLESGSVVLFKEYYHSSWKAKEFPSENKLKIFKAGPGFMLVMPLESTEKVIFYQSRTLIDYIGIFLTFAGVIILLIKINQYSYFSAALYHCNDKIYED